MQGDKRGNRGVSGGLVGAACLASVFLPLRSALAADQPQWGQRFTRNMVSAETNLPAAFDAASGSNVWWTAELGTETHATPVVAGGRVYIGTNNGRPRDPRQTGDRGALMCFDELTGRFLWQRVVPKITNSVYWDWTGAGVCSPPSVEDDRVYVVSSRGEVMCLDARGLTNGNDGPFHDEGRHMVPAGRPALKPGPTDADILWLYDMIAELHVRQHDSAHASILIDGRFLYLNTSNGVVYGFEPVAEATPEVQTLRKIWWFDTDPTGPKSDVHRYTTNRTEGPNTVHGMPVVANGRVYVAEGGDIWWGKQQAWLFCIDPTRSGDVTGSAKIWQYALNRHVLATPAVADGLAFIADIGRKVHCVDAATGAPYWTYDVQGAMWASTLVADCKVYVATRRGEFAVLAASRERRVLFSTMLDGPVSGTPVAANGALFVATQKRLYALKKPKE